MDGQETCETERMEGRVNKLSPGRRSRIVLTSMLKTAAQAEDMARWKGRANGPRRRFLVPALRRRHWRTRSPAPTPADSACSRCISSHFRTLLRFKSLLTII